MQKVVDKGENKGYNSNCKNEEGGGQKNNAPPKEKNYEKDFNTYYDCDTRYCLRIRFNRLRRKGNDQD